MARFLLVKGIEGRKLLDPRTIGMHQHFISHERKVVGKRPDPYDRSKTIERVEHVFNGEEERVPEPFDDHFFRRGIGDGCIAYLGTIDVSDDDAKAETTFREADLVRATSIHKAVRERAAKEAADHAVKAKESADKAATDADSAGQAHLDTLDKAAADAKQAIADGKKAAADKLAANAKGAAAQVGAPKSSPAPKTDPV